MADRTEHWRNRLTKMVIPWLRNMEEELIFKSSVAQPKILAPKEYVALGFKTLADFREEYLRVVAQDGTVTRLGLWVREPDDDSKPIYVLFHGRHGHWGDTRLNSSEPVASDSRTRLAWLNEIAQTGAGIIAVHSRRQGLSRGTDPHVGERWYQYDIDRLAKYLVKERNIAPQRLIVVGSSMGGALATMLAERLTKNGHPPAVLGMINSLACMADGVAQFLRNKKFLMPPLTAVELPAHPDAEAICLEHCAIVEKHLRNTFNTDERLGALDPGHTSVYIAHAPEDLTVPFYQHEKLCAAARARGLHMKERTLQGEWLLPNCCDAHADWQPKKILGDLQDLYKDRRS